jgi:uncharacterized membrane protein
VVVLSFVSIFGLASTVFAQDTPEDTQSSYEQIRSFESDIVISADSTIKVKETILYDFANLERHGIYRVIPLTTLKNSIGKIQISDIRVEDETGAAYNFTVSGSGKKNIKIGDKDILISGKKTYIISYTVKNALQYFDSFDELYWNATGDEWLIPINNAETRVTLPKAVDTSSLKLSCYQGVRGSTRSCTSVFSEPSISTVTFKLSERLESYQGMTIGIGFPKGIVQLPSLADRILAFIREHILHIISSLVVIGIALRLIRTWMLKGRDPKGRGTIVPQYSSPEQLTPMEIDAVLKEYISAKAISSEIIYLATLGYIKIELDQSEYSLVKLKESTGLIKNFHRTLLDKLFANEAQVVSMTSLKNKFYKHLPAIKKEVMDGLVAKNIYEQNPTTIRDKYVAGGIICIVIGFFLLAFVTFELVILGIVFIIVGIAMPKKTVRGAVLKEDILGFKMYLQIAEKDRINFHNAPEKKPELFETLLPFAMVLGVEKAWAKEFEDIYMEPPTWYSSTSGTAFNAGVLTSNMSAFGATAGTALTSTPSSSSSGSGGGGSSGGGGGGGGGGSW